MNLILDVRENKLIEDCNKLIKSVPMFKKIILKIETLEIGDVIIRKDETELIICERKSISDLIASIKDGRYTEQSFRLNGSSYHNHNIYYIIEGSCKYLSKEKQMVYSSMISLNYFKGFSVIKSESVHETAYILCNMLLKLEKENKPGFYKNKIVEEVNKETDEDDIENKEATYISCIKKKKSDNITVDNFGSIILCQIPSVSSVTAEIIMKEYKTINNLIDKLKEDSKCLDNLKYKTDKNVLRKISKTSISNIIKFLIQ
jgi:ERCC4-type nuclease